MHAASSVIPPRFNKYSGIIEWKNSAFLFVNVDSVPYDNVFLRSGRQIVWFAQPTQSPDSRVIARILKFAQKELELERFDSKPSFGCNSTHQENSCTETTEGIVLEPLTVHLFCRLVQISCPYVYCGELKWSDVDITIRPLRFVWELQNFDELQRSEAFQLLLTSASTQQT